MSGMGDQWHIRSTSPASDDNNNEEQRRERALSYMNSQNAQFWLGWLTEWLDAGLIVKTEDTEAKAKALMTALERFLYSSPKQQEQEQEQGEKPQLRPMEDTCQDER